MDATAGYRGGSRAGTRSRDASDDIERDGGEGVWSVRGDARERRARRARGAGRSVCDSPIGVNSLDVVLIYGELAPANREIDSIVPSMRLRRRSASRNSQFIHKSLPTPRSRSRSTLRGRENALAFAQE